MLDKNGVEIRTGDVVRVSGSYFEVDNGLYYVENSPGDPSWCGKDHSLHRLCKNGRVSERKGSVAFWPLVAFTNDRRKNAAAREWNAEHAEIEVLKFDKKDGIRSHFEEKAMNVGEKIRGYVFRGGDENVDWIVNLKKQKAHFEAVAARLAT